MSVLPGTGWQHPPTNRGGFAGLPPPLCGARPMVLVWVSHMRQVTLSEFQVSPFRVIMCVIAPVTLSSNGNNLANSRLFNLLQPISTLFNYLCLVT
uniref:Uncharacterized protein n=1 Tax=Siphoviridae sp. ct1Eo1 TaxID=2825307 RepID=A0A8S5P6N6_9CAUD|nr:MAG TPA: hypothetical protein [Siphoviridae sp. ct1Eo1]